MAVAASLTGKYQVIFFGDQSQASVADAIGRCDRAVRSGIDALGVNSKKFLVTSAPYSRAVAVDRKMPAVGIYFGLTVFGGDPAADSTLLDTLIADGHLVIPVVNDLTAYSGSVPASLREMNGLPLAEGGSDFERLVARVLEGFSLLRERRRLFISYRRAESSGVAAQLYEALDMAGYDVFLDTHGVIQPGEPFQEILWHRLADTDVAVLLDTPDFLASRWTEEELARANSSNLQILQILWPNQQEVSAAAFSTFFPLAEADFSTTDRIGPVALLSGDRVREIVDSVEGLRARAMNARHNFLVREFLVEARDEGLTARTTLERNLVLVGPSGSRTLVVPAIGIPDAERYQEIVRIRERDTAIGISYDGAPVLLFDERGIRSRWLAHLDWLNDNLQCARSISLQSVRRWLAAVKGASK